MQPGRFLTSSLQDWRIARILDRALLAVDPEMLVTEQLKHRSLPPHHRLYLLGVGKASEAMTRGAANTLGRFASGLLVTKESAGPLHPRITVLTAGHPIPDARSLAAGRAILRFVSALQPDDLLICLISGGGSALASVPLDGTSLEDVQALTSSALASGGTIEDVNILRRQLDQLKGGGLAQATQASILSLILSDVLGDRVEVVASGPTVPTPTGPQQARDVLAKLGIEAPPAMDHALEAPRPVRSSSLESRVDNVVIGNVLLAARGAVLQAQKEGFAADLLDTQIQGEAQLVGRALAGQLVEQGRDRPRPFCLVAAGETTVTLATQGLGGRNQELALSAVEVLDGSRNCMLVALATDGNDGPTNAAGAVVTSETQARATAVGLSSQDYLARHDSYRFFEPLGDLLMPGYTGTNVNDLMLLIGL